MITDIITKAPVWAWPLFAYLIFVGIKASKTQVFPLGILKKLMIIPAVFFIWALYSILMHRELSEIIPLMAGVMLGSCIGYLLVRRQALRFDTTNQTIEIPGSWMTLILALSIFSLKFSLGAISSIHPELKGTWILFSIEWLAALISGIFVGRGINYWHRYKSTMIAADE